MFRNYTEGCGKNGDCQSFDGKVTATEAGRSVKKTHLIILSFSLLLGLNGCAQRDWQTVPFVTPTAFNGGNGPKLVRMSVLNLEDRIEFSQPVIRADSLVADGGVGPSVALEDIIWIESGNTGFLAYWQPALALAGLITFVVEYWDFLLNACWTC